MKRRVGIVKNGVVENVIIVDDTPETPWNQFDAGEDVELVDAGELGAKGKVGRGWVRNAGGKFENPRKPDTPQPPISEV